MRSWVPPLFLSFYVICSCAAGAEPPATSPTTDLMIGAAAEPASIRLLHESKVLDFTARRLSEFISLRTGGDVEIKKGQTVESDRGVVVLLGREGDPGIRALTSEGASALPDMEDYRDDGYAI